MVQSKAYFAALNEHGIGTSRHFAAARQFARFLGEAGIIRQAKPAELVENVTYTWFDLSAVMFPQYVLAGVRGCQ
jgi:hypothetical protein